MLTVAGRTGSILLGCAALAVASLPLFASPYHLELVSTAVVLAMFALSLQLLVGGTGLVSLGHAAFFGIGAYGQVLEQGTPASIRGSAAVRDAYLGHAA